MLTKKQNRTRGRAFLGFCFFGVVVNKRKMLALTYFPGTSPYKYLRLRTA